VAIEFSATERRLGIFSAVGVVVLGVAYAVTLATGFLSLKSPQKPIGDPMFSILEVLIIVMTPVMVALMVAVHAWAPSHAKAFSLTAIVFMGLLAGVTCSLHFVILTLSRQAAFAGQLCLPKTQSRGIRG
jgi:cytochrome bd-type quinol oxidase subunit 2